MGGTGGGLVNNAEELRIIAARGIAASMVGQVLVEESVLGWEELELEVVRDSKNQKITVCFIENVDAAGIHTGDSFCTAPMLTISPELQRRMQKYAYDVVEAIGVIAAPTFSSHTTETGRVVIIESIPAPPVHRSCVQATAILYPYISNIAGRGLTLEKILLRRKA
jgi:carbamoyl-phosphate synthase large subunit